MRMLVSNLRFHGFRKCRISQALAAILFRLRSCRAQYRPDAPRGFESPRLHSRNTSICRRQAA